MTLPGYFAVVLGRALPAYQEEDARLATLLGAAEALEAGITSVFDWSNTPHTEAVVDALEASGMRAVVGQTNVDTAKRFGGRVTGGLAILGPQYGSWDDSMREIATGRELGLTISMHASGGTDSPFARMYAEGLLGPDLHLVHMNAMTDDESRMLADAGVGVTVTPVVEATMGHGTSVLGKFLAAGGYAGLGTDVVVNATADLFEPMRDTLRFERMRTQTMVPAASILAHATVHSARAIGLSDVGVLTVGKRADVIVLEGLAHLTGDKAGAVVTSLTPANVRDVLVDGAIVKRDGKLVHHDLLALRQAADELARRVLAVRD
jgi:cytosine/adenosine deaminase-related metal-dependent hydrolase